MASSCLRPCLRTAGKTTSSDVEESGTPRICVVGSGSRFLSGISYYTHELATALSQRCIVSVILMRRLIPARLYPGRARVGHELSVATYPPQIEVFDGVDWFWGRSLLGAIRFIRQNRPDVVILEWWTGAVLHTYLVIAGVARLMRRRVIVEFHEVQDVGEQRIPLVGNYVNVLFPALLRMASGSVVHSRYDRAALTERFGNRLTRTIVLPHAPYSFHNTLRPSQDACSGAARPGDIHLLYFGVIRPFKGVDDLVMAFNGLTNEEAARYRLTIIGEPWEGFDVANLVAGSPHRDRIELIDRYIHDGELARYLEEADAMVLPYHRSSSSGPLSVAMGVGLPVILTRVGGLEEAASQYDGAIFVEPHDVEMLRDAVLKVERLKGCRFESPWSWEQTADALLRLVSEIAV